MSPNGMAAYGMYSRHAALTEIVCSLNQAGFENQDICMVMSPAHPVAEVVRDARIVHEQREQASVGARLIGWCSELGAVVIPSVGFFIRSQAFFRALMREQNFPGLCGGSKTLAGLGFSEGEAKRLNHQLSDIGVMVYIACPESSKADRAIDVLRRAGAREAASLEPALAAGAAA